MQPWFSVPIDWRKPKAAQSYHLYWCQQSEYGMVYPRPTVDQVRSFYDLDYYTHHLSANLKSRSLQWLGELRSKIVGRLDFGVEPTERWWQQTLATLKQTAGIALETPLSCCEIGCGNGGTLTQLQRLGQSVVGIEPDRRAQAVARQSGVHVVEGTAEHLPEAIAHQQFDVVILNHVLEHCLDPMLALTNAKKLLKPDGLLVLETPNNNAIGCHLSGNTWPWLDVPRHLNFFTARSLALICQQAGFQPEKVEYRGYWRQFAPLWQQEELEICQAFTEATHAHVPNLEFRYWWLFLRTLFAADDRKYDSVRILARKIESHGIQDKALLNPVMKEGVASVAAGSLS